MGGRGGARGDPVLGLLLLLLLEAGAWAAVAAPDGEGREFLKGDVGADLMRVETKGDSSFEALL